MLERKHIFHLLIFLQREKRRNKRKNEMKKGKANAHKFIRKEETIKKKFQYGEIINCKYTADFGNYLIYL